MTSILLSLLVSSSFSSILPSKQLPSDSIKNKQIKEVTVYSNLSKTLALPMAVVEKNSLDLSSYFTPADALQRETGISLSRDGIWATSVNVRGLSEQRLLFLVNGDRIQTATDVAASLSTINMNNLERIEVIKGASSVLYGSGAMGGVVNLVTHQPTFSPTYQPNGVIGTEFNTVNSLWTNFAQLQFCSSKFYLGLDGSFRSAGNTRTPDGKLANSQFSDASWGVTAGILYSPTQEIQVNYQHAGAWDVGLPGGSAFTDNAIVRYKNVRRNQLSAEYIIKNINPILREVRIKAYTQNFEREVENKAVTIFPTVTVLPSSNNKTWGVKTTGDWRFSDNNSLLLGVEGWQRKVETSRLRIKTNADSTYVVSGEIPTPNANMFDLGVFAHYSWKLVPQKITINLGLRADYVRQHNDSLYDPLFKYSVVREKTSTGENTGNWTEIFDKNLVRKVLFVPETHADISYSAHVDFVYNPTSQQQLALSLSNSYRVASIEERFKYIDQGGVLRVGNPNLKPEKGYFSNLSYTLSYNKVNLKAEFFANYMTDLIAEKIGRYTYRNTQGMTMTLNNAYVNTNINKALLIGGELETRWFICRSLSFLANVSYVRGRDIDADTYLPQIPPLHGFTSLTYQLKKKFEATFSALWAAHQSDVANSEKPTDGHIIFNVDVQMPKIPLQRSYLHFSAGVDNLMDKAYYNPLSTTRGLIKLEPGRNVYVKAKWRW